jgi:hypothetical protein
MKLIYWRNIKDSILFVEGFGARIHWGVDITSVDHHIISM